MLHRWCMTKCCVYTQVPSSSKVLIIQKCFLDNCSHSHSLNQAAGKFTKYKMKCLLTSPMLRISRSMDIENAYLQNLKEILLFSLVIRNIVVSLLSFIVGGVCLAKWYH